MSQDNHLRTSPKVASSIASLKWMELSFKILKSNFWSFLSFAILILIVNITLTFLLALVGIFLSFCIYMFFSASISINSKKIQNAESLPLKEFFNFNQTNAKQLVLSSVIYCAVFLMIIITAMVPSAEIFNFTPEQISELQALDFQGQIKYFESILIESPEKYSKILQSSLMLTIGVFVLESIMFFVPTLLVLHPSLNVFTAIKLSTIGVLKNSIPFIAYGLILTIFGFAIFLLFLKISTFIAYQEIFLDETPDNFEGGNSDNKKPYEYKASEHLDSRDF